MRMCSGGSAELAPVVDVIFAPAAFDAEPRAVIGSTATDAPFGESPAASVAAPAGCVLASAFGSSEVPPFAEAISDSATPNMTSGAALAGSPTAAPPAPSTVAGAVADAPATAGTFGTSTVVGSATCGLFCKAASCAAASATGSDMVLLLVSGAKGRVLIPAHPRAHCGAEHWVRTGVFAHAAFESLRAFAHEPLDFVATQHAHALL